MEVVVPFMIAIGPEKFSIYGLHAAHIVPKFISCIAMDKMNYSGCFSYFFVAS